MTTERPLQRGSAFLATLLIVFGFGLRLYGAATMPFNVDEQCVVSCAQGISPAPGKFSPPTPLVDHSSGALYLARAGTLFFGWNRLGARLANVLLGTATLRMVYRFACTQFGSRAGLWSLLLLSLNPFHIGISRTALLEQYLCLAFLAMILFWKAVTLDRRMWMVGAGLALGLGCWIKEVASLLIPISAGYLYWTRNLRRWLMRKSTLLALGLVSLPLLLLFYDNVMYNLFPGPQWGLEGHIPLQRRLEFLSPLTFNIKPASLYHPSLYFRFQKPADSPPFEDTPMMDHLSGGILLVGACYAWRMRRRLPILRYLLAIFFSIFGLFTFFVDSLVSEFWWADLSFLPGILFGGIFLERVTRNRLWRWGIAAALGGWLLWCAVFSVTQPTLAFDGRFIAPAGEVVRNIRDSIRQWFPG